MANSINNVKDAAGIIAKMGAAMLADKCQFAKTIDKADSNDFQGKNGFMAGDTIQINKPARFIPGTSADISSDIQDVSEEKVALALDIRKVIGVSLTSAEIATELALKSWAKRILEPAVSSMAQHIEQTMLERAADATYNVVGTPGSTVFDTDTILAAGARIDENACPDFDNRFVLLNPQANRSAVNARKGLFQSADLVAKQYKSGAMGMSDGFTFLRNNLMSTHTNGNDVTFEVRTTVSAEGATSIVVEGLTTSTGTVTKGTVFTIDTVFAVHPITKETLDYLQPFTVTADATADGSGFATLNVSPAIYTSASGGLQSVSAFPVDEDTCNVLTGSASTGYRQNLAYHKSAYRMVSVPLVMPDGLDMAAQESHAGFTLRVIRDYDVKTDELVMRLDFLGGFAATRPEWASRITS